MELLDRERSLLLLIDYQGKLMDQVYRPGLVLEAASRLIRLAGIFGVPVLMTEQYPRGLGPTHPELVDLFDKLEVPTRLLDKTSFGCCGDAAFDRAIGDLLPDVPLDRRQIVVGGIEAHVCVMQTVLPMRRSGTEVHLVWDAVSSRGEEYRRHALERMATAGAVITNHESVGFEWARDKNHPKFKEMSALFKEGQPSG